MCNKMRIGIKLIISFLLITFLLIFVGIFGFTTSNTIQKNDQVVIEIIEIEKLLDDSLVQVLQLIETHDLDEYYRMRSEIEQIRIEFDSLYKKNKELINSLSDTFEEDIAEFSEVSDDIINVQKKKLTQQEEFAEKYVFEKESRHSIRNSLELIDDIKLRGDIALMEYYSKETLFQYQDKTHLDKWVNSIEIVKEDLRQANISRLEKESFLIVLNSYGELAPEIGKIVIEQKRIEVDEREKIEHLTEIIKKLELDEEKMTSSIKYENESLSRTTYYTLLGVIIVSFLASTVLGAYIANSVSKPLQKLTEVTKKISKGKLNTTCKIDSKDEVGELANSFENMRVGLKDRNDLLNSLLKTFRGKSGGIASILVKKNIKELVKKNPRIIKIIPNSISKSIKKEEKIKKVFR